MKRIILALLITLALALPVHGASTIYARVEPETAAFFTTAYASTIQPTAAQTQFAVDQNVKAVKFASGLIYASASCYLSVEDNFAFVHTPSVDLRPFSGFKVTFNDGSKNLVAWLGGFATVETLSDSLIDGWVNGATQVYETLTTSGLDITSAVNAAGGQATCSDSVSVAIGNGGLVKWKIGSFTQNSGGKPNFSTFNDASELPSTSGHYAYYGTTWVANTDYYSTGASTAHIYFGFRNQGTAAADWSASGIEIKQVTTPNVSGIWLTSTEQGVTNSITSMESGFILRFGLLPPVYTITITRN